MASERFPKSLRLRRRAEYLAVQRRGRKVHGELFLVMLLAGSSETRVGITVSSKVGNSVVRNRIKRWVREYVRRHRAELPAGADLVVVAKAPAATATHEAVDRDMARLLERARA